jgi:hypothetical protein
MLKTLISKTTSRDNGGDDVDENSKNKEPAFDSFAKIT